MDHRSESEINASFPNEAFAHPVSRDHEFYTFWVSRDRERAEELQTKLDSLERRQITTEAEATDGSNSSRYYHTRLSRNPSSRVNYNER